MESVKSISKSASSSGHTTEQKPAYDFLNGFLTSYARPSRKLSTKEISSLKTDPGVTKVGKFMRRTSLDELPQLFNILKGDISIVGLRPVMEVKTEIYGNYRDMLLSIKPGLTGFRVANGRSCATYARRRAMEVCYIKNRSVCFDLKIILKTITSVFKGEGAV